MQKTPYERLDDYDVVRLCLQGETEAFSVLVSRYKNLVYSVILRMVSNPDDAADLSQEVFIRLYKNLDKYRPEFKFSTWVIKITTNRVIDYRRQQKPSNVSFDDISEPYSEYLTPEESVVSEERKQTVWGAVRGLPDMYKIPIVLYHQQGLSYQEISDITGEPLSKVKNRIFRGRKMLKDSLGTGLREAYGL